MLVCNYTTSGCVHKLCVCRREATAPDHPYWCSPLPTVTDAVSEAGSSMSNLRSFGGRRVFFPAQLGDLTMMTCDRKRSVLLLLCGAAVLLAGCVSQGQYNTLQG